MNFYHAGVFLSPQHIQNMDVSKNRGIPKWMVQIMYDAFQVFFWGPQSDATNLRSFRIFRAGYLL